MTEFFTNLFKAKQILLKVRSKLILDIEHAACS